jgi:hypothetical protein
MNPEANERALRRLYLLLNGDSIPIHRHGDHIHIEAESTPHNPRPGLNGETYITDPDGSMRVVRGELGPNFEDRFG